MATNDDIYNALVAASLPVEIVTPDNAVHWRSDVGMTAAQLQQGVDIIMSFTNPTAYANLITDRNRLSAAKTAIANHPWAAQTQAQIQSYYDTNLADSVVDTFTTVPIPVRTYLKKQSLALLYIWQMFAFVRDLYLPGLAEGNVNTQGPQKL